MYRHLFCFPPFQGFIQQVLEEQAVTCRLVIQQKGAVGIRDGGFYKYGIECLEYDRSPVNGLVRRVGDFPVIVCAVAVPSIVPSSNKMLTKILFISFVSLSFIIFDTAKLKSPFCFWVKARLTLR